MSSAAPVTNTALKPTVTAGPWRKAGIFGAVIGSVGIVVVFSSSRDLPFLRHHRSHERAIEVQMNGPITRLEKPVEQHLPPPARPAVLSQARVLNSGNDDETRKAAESPISAFALGGPAGTAP